MSELLLDDIKSFINISPDAVFICDLEGKIQLINQEAVQLFGYEQTELIGKPIEVLIPHHMREKHKHHRTNYTQNAHLREMGKVNNINGLHKSGHEIPLDINLNPFVAKNHTKHSYIIATVRNISHIKKMQSSLEQQAENTAFINEKLTTALDHLNETLAELQLKNEQLKDMNQEKNQFLGIAAHDLRNPLNAILGYSKLLLSHTFGEMKDQQQYLIQRIERSSDFMLELVNDLLDITAIESGQVQLQKKPTDIQRLIEEVIALERVIADQKQIQIKFLCRDTLPNISIDANKIEQVIHNLLSNSRKFSNPNTVIKVDLRVKEKSIFIDVIDQGQGISEDDLEHLFDPFTKTSTRATGGEKSTGLGLAIVKRIIESHDGAICVKSTPNIGSTFTIELPL